MYSMLLDWGRSLGIGGQATFSTPTTSSNADEQVAFYVPLISYWLVQRVCGENNIMVCAQGVARNFLQVCETYTAERTHKWEKHWNTF